MAKFAAIDIGSNAIRLRIVEAERDGSTNTYSIRDIVSRRASIRLGREVFLTGELAPQAISDAVLELGKFHEEMVLHGGVVYRAVATSAAREARNGHILVQRAESESKIHIEIIDGVEEARLVRLAVISKLELKHQSAILIDIGGGSTEISWLQAGEVLDAKSLPIGTVRLLEAFVGSQGVVGQHQDILMREYIERLIAELPTEIMAHTPDMLVATGGNVETLASLFGVPNALHPTLDVRRLLGELNSLCQMTSSQRAQVFSLRADRADTLVPAAYILSILASKWRHTSIVSPGVGLKEGILQELIQKNFSQWDFHGEEHAILEDCLRLGRRFRFDETHGKHVAHLACQIFDDLSHRHGFDRRIRLLLRVAALLHDVGDMVGYEKHHKHSQYIIANSEIMGLLPTERDIVAQVARYHRKGPPSLEHLAFAQLSSSARNVIEKLVAILRLADALDREHLSKIKSVHGTVAGNSFYLELAGDPEHILEEWTLQRKVDLFQRVFALKVELAESQLL